MADGVTFEIAVEAQGLGVDATAAQLNAFAEQIRAANTVATQFDSVVAAASARLTEASAAAQLAASALDAGQSKYKELEGAANRASKEVERASLAGKDTSALQAAADAAAAKMREQGAAVDELRAKSLEAAAAEDKLAASLRELKSQQASAAAGLKKGLGPGPEQTGNLPKGADKIDGLSTSLVEAAGAAEIAAAAIAAVVVGVVALALKAQPGMMSRFSGALARMQKGILGLFSGLKLDKFMAAIENIGSFFDKGTSSANGLKKIIEVLFQPLIDAATFLAPYMKEMFKGILYGVLLVVLGVLLLRNKILEAMSPETRKTIKDMADRVFTLQNFFWLGVVVVGVLASVMLGLAIATFIASIPILLMIGLIALVVLAIMNWSTVVAKLEKVWDDFVAGASDAAADMIDGLVTGIENGAGAVWQAMKNMADGAIKKFKAALGISSPSKVFALQGHFTTAGYAQGIEEGTPRVESALESMSAVPDASPASSSSGGATAPSGATSGARTIHIETLTVGGSSVATANWAELRRMLLDVLEGASITIGGGEAPAT